MSKPWTMKDLAFLRENAPIMSIRDMAAALNRSAKCTASTMKRHAIKTGRTGCFPKGNQPHNKGTQGVMKPNKTSFRPGIVPANSLFDGAVTIRTDTRGAKYKHIRVDGVWLYLHRVEWEKANGPIPHNHILVCKNGDTLNEHPSNWQPITRAEHARRNANRTKAAESMKKTWDRVKRMEAVGIQPHDVKLKSKRNASVTNKTSPMLIVDMEHLTKAPNRII